MTQIVDGIARHRRATPRLLVAALVLATAACGRQAQPPETLRPVLVVQAGNATSGELDAFAGEVRAREESALAFRVGGKVVRRLVDAGDRVKRGDVLAELDPGDLRLQAEALQAQAAAAEAQLARARSDHARISALSRDQLVSRSTLDQQTAALRAAEGQARAARAQLDVARNQAGYTRLLAPQDGVIAVRQIEAGQVVAAGQTAFTLAADSGREVAFALPESNIRDFSVGQAVTIEPWNAKGRLMPGRIREIAPAADPQARTYAARATLDGEAAGTVDLGQSVRVYIPQDIHAGLRVPTTAVLRGAKGGDIVRVVDPKTHVVRDVAVTIGPYASEGVEVRSGLKSGDWLVAVGGHLLRAGEKVQPVDRDNRPLGGH